MRGLRQLLSLLCLLGLAAVWSAGAHAASSCTPTGAPATAAPGTLLETCIVDPTDVIVTDSGVVSLIPDTTTVFEPDLTYVARISGVFGWERVPGETSNFDAFWCFAGPVCEFNGGTAGSYRDGSLCFEGTVAEGWVLVGATTRMSPGYYCDDAPIDYAGDHVYEVRFTGAAGPLEFSTGWLGPSGTGTFTIELSVGDVLPPDEDIEQGAGGCLAPARALASAQATELCIPASPEGRWYRYPDELDGDRTYEIRVRGTINIGYPGPPEGQGHDAIYCYWTCNWTRSARLHARRGDGDSGAALDDFARRAENGDWNGSLNPAAAHTYTVEVTGVDTLEFQVPYLGENAYNNTGAFYVTVVDVTPPDAQPVIDTYNWGFVASKTLSRKKKKGRWIVTELKTAGKGKLGIHSPQGGVESVSGSVRLVFLQYVCADKNCGTILKKSKRVADFSLLLTGASLNTDVPSTSDLRLQLAVKKTVNWASCAKKPEGAVRVIAAPGPDKLALRACGSKVITSWKVNDPKTGVVAA